MDATFELPPFRLCGQALLFAWRMCLFFSPIMLALSVDASAYLVSGRLSFLVSCVVGLSALACLKHGGSSALPQRSGILAGAALAAGGSALVVFGSSSNVSNMVVAMCGYVAAGIGDSLLALSFGRLYSGLSVKLSMRAVPIALVFAAVLYAAVSNGVPVVGIPIVVAMPVACGAVLLFDLSRKGVASVEGAEASIILDPEKTRFSKWKISSYTAVLWFSFGFMWSLAAVRIFLDVRLFSSFSLSVTALIIIIALAVAGLTYVLKLPTVKTFWIFVPLTVAGVSVVAVVDSNMQVFAFASVFAARGIAEMQLITHFAAICRRRGYCPATLFGGGFAILSAGEVAGVLSGAAIAEFGSMELTMILLLCANVIVIAVILSILRVNAAFQKAELESALAKHSVTQPNSVEPSAPDAVARAWAGRSGLSSREEEVAALLLAGRNVPAIAEMLCISQSTVHTHVKRIYEKMGVHSRQELIDLRDEYANG